MEHRYTNHLIHETSPYLLQHAHNPVNWYPWGPQALSLAKEQNKPIFLSVGYAACHWCHVMEHESFEDVEIARLLNEHFVSIKVDREERPDLDEIYMNATILFTRGQGGWPMSVFLTPDGKPFYAGTYFPPEDYYGRPGFKSVLMRVAEVWREKAPEVSDDASQVAEIIRKLQSPGGGEIPSREEVSEAARQTLEAFDLRYGGVASGANKFPPSMAMELLLREYSKTGDPQVLAAVDVTLEHMRRGGIYDQLGGGIHRYSTDREWLVPHFEKMLYDQALVSSIYLDGYQVTHNPDFREAAQGIFDYVIRVLQSEEGGFYSTEDADSEGMEGKFYIWTLEEVKQVLGEEEAPLFCAYYDITEQGNWKHPGDAHVPSGVKSILRVLRPRELVAREFQVDSGELERRLRAGRAKLFAVREKRVHPALDDKILAAWNGLMIASLAKGFSVLQADGSPDAPRYLDAAIQAAGFVLSKMQEEGRLLRSYRRGQAHLMAYSDDYAFLIEGLIGLYEATGSITWLDEAEKLMDTAIRNYWDERDGGFFFTAADHEQLIVRRKLSEDSAIPSGNSVMVTNLLRLRLLLGRDEFRERAARILTLFSGGGERSPFGHQRLLCALEAWHEGFREIAVVGPSDDPRTQELFREAWHGFRPNQVLAWLDEASPEATRVRSRLPLLADKSTVNGNPVAYLCRNYACQIPATDPEMLHEQLTIAH